MKQLIFIACFWDKKSIRGVFKYNETWSFTDLWSHVMTPYKRLHPVLHNFYYHNLNIHKKFLDNSAKLVQKKLFNDPFYLTLAITSSVDKLLFTVSLNYEMINLFCISIHTRNTSDVYLASLILEQKMFVKTSWS